MFAASFDELLSLRPELQAKYQHFLSAINNSDKVPSSVLSACQKRIRQIHGLEADTGVSTSDAAEQLALAIAEKMPYQHHELLDEEVAEVKQIFGDAGCVALLTALAFFDTTSRLELAFAGDT